MARAETVIRDNAAHVWSVLAEPACWDRLFYEISMVAPALPTFGMIGGGAPGPGARIGMYHKRKLRQTWIIEDWQPPRRLAMRIESATLYPLEGSATFEIMPVDSL